MCTLISSIHCWWLHARVAVLLSFVLASQTGVPFHWQTTQALQQCQLSILYLPEIIFRYFISHWEKSRGNQYQLSSQLQLNSHYKQWNTFRRVRFQRANVTFSITWDHSYWCHSISHIWLLISLPLQLWLYLAPLLRYYRRCYQKFKNVARGLIYHACTNNTQYQPADQIWKVTGHFAYWSFRLRDISTDNSIYCASIASCIKKGVNSLFTDNWTFTEPSN